MDFIDNVYIKLAINGTKDVELNSNMPSSFFKNQNKTKDETNKINHRINK